MKTYIFTHANGRQEEVEGKHVLDAVFSYRGNYVTLKSVAEKPKAPEPPKPQAETPRIQRAFDSPDGEWHGTDNHGWKF